MSDKATKRPAPTEAQPLSPLPMPKYGFQREQRIHLSASDNEQKKKSQANNQSLDLSGVVLNLA